MFLLRHGQSYFNLHFTANRIDPGALLEYDPASPAPQSIDWSS